MGSSRIDAIISREQSYNERLNLQFTNKSPFSNTHAKLILALKDTECIFTSISNEERLELNENIKDILQVMDDDSISLIHLREKISNFFISAINSSIDDEIENYVDNIVLSQMKKTWWGNGFEAFRRSNSFQIKKMDTDSTFSYIQNYIRKHENANFLPCIFSNETKKDTNFSFFNNRIRFPMCTDLESMHTLEYENSIFFNAYTFSQNSQLTFDSHPNDRQSAVNGQLAFDSQLKRPVLTNFENFAPVEMRFHSFLNEADGLPHLNHVFSIHNKSKEKVMVLGLSVWNLNGHSPLMPIEMKWKEGSLILNENSFVGFAVKTPYNHSFSHPNMTYNWSFRKLASNRVAGNIAKSVRKAKVKSSNSVCIVPENKEEKLKQEEKEEKKNTTLKRVFDFFNQLNRKRLKEPEE